MQRHIGVTRFVVSLNRPLIRLCQNEPVAGVAPDAFAARTEHLLPPPWAGGCNTIFSTPALVPHVHTTTPETAMRAARARSPLTLNSSPEALSVQALWGAGGVIHALLLRCKLTDLILNTGGPQTGSACGRARQSVLRS